MSPTPDIEKNVLEKIRSGSVPMRPRTYFLLQKSFWGALALVDFLAAIFVLSFAIFSVQESGEHFLLEFSTRGLTTFLVLFPWVEIGIFLLLLIALEWLLRKFTSAYRFSLLRIFLWVLVAGLIGSSFLELTPLHAFLLSESDHNKLPILGPLYEEVHDSHVDHGIYRGIVGTLGDSYFVITYDDRDRDSDEGTWNVIPPSSFDLHTLKTGDHVYVGGRLQNNVIYAYGIQRLDGPNM